MCKPSQYITLCGAEEWVCSSRSSGERQLEPQRTSYYTYRLYLLLDLRARAPELFSSLEKGPIHLAVPNSYLRLLLISTLPTIMEINTTRPNIPRYRDNRTIRKRQLWPFSIYFLKKRKREASDVNPASEFER